jgi:DHA1 family multidrug resistance protein-like MFS transporter
MRACGTWSSRPGRSAPVWGMVVRAMGCGAVIAFLMPLAQNPGELIVLRVLQGVFTGSVAASLALVAAAVPREKLGYAMGLMQMAVFTGSSIGTLVGGQLVDRIGFQPTFLVAALLLAVATLPTCLYVGEHFEPAPFASASARPRFWASV